MKFFATLSILLIAGCASNRTPDMPEFKKEKVCSPEALERVKSGPTVDPKVMHHSPEEIRERIITFQPVIQKCYEEEMLRSGSSKAFNLCFVTEFDKKGVEKFFQFSSQETVISPELTKCLNQLKNSNALRGLKSVTILQPFRLYPMIK